MSNEIATTGSTAMGIVPQVDIRELVDTNLNGQIRANDLDRIKIPSGGTTSWEVPTLDGEEMVKQLEGVIIHTQMQNAYWAMGIEEGGNTPPDCASPDSIYGAGTPGGACATCPLNQFGSDPGGKGKACKNQMVVFLLRQGSLLPMAIFLPPTSIPIAKKFFMRLTSAGVPYYGVVSQLTLEKTKNDKCIDYSILKIAAKRVNVDGATDILRISLDAPTLTAIREYREQIIPALRDVTLQEAAAAAE